MMTPKLALLIATIAHGAVGQMRWMNAREKVPYIVHPKRVKLLTAWFMKRYWTSDIMPSLVGPRHEPFAPSKESLDALFVAAYLHDVLEDTKLTRAHLLEAGISYTALDYVERLTKPDDGPAKPEYYQGISESVGALVIKCADRCSNLEDACKELFAPVEEREVKRWANYIEASYRDVLPMYDHLPGLQSEIQWRLDRIEQVMPLARRERQAHVYRKRLEAAAKFHKLTVAQMEPLCWDCGKSYDEPGVPAICAAGHKAAA